MSVTPNFRRGVDGLLLLRNSLEGDRVKDRNKKSTEVFRCLSPRDVRRLAVDAVAKRGGSSADEMHVLSEHIIQFGEYRGQTFLWLLENCLGYTAWLVESLKGETESNSHLSANKFLLRKFVLSFPELEEAMDLRRKVLARNAARKTLQSKPVATLVNATHLTPARVVGKVKASMSVKHFVPNLAGSRQCQSAAREELSDEVLYAEAAKAERQLVSSGMRSIMPLFQNVLI